MSFLSQLSSTLSLPYCRKAIVLVPKTPATLTYLRSHLVASPTSGKLIKKVGKHEYLSSWGYIEVEPERFLQVCWENGRWVDAMSCYFITDAGHAIRPLPEDASWGHEAATIDFEIPHTEVPWADDDDDEYEEDLEF